jgi:hypothetical protein
MSNGSIPAWFNRFAAKVNVATGECWTWTAARNQAGYGFFRLDNRMRLAHRLSYELANGTLDDNVILDHICRNRACINPDHLREVTQKQNMENQGAHKNSKSGVRGVTWTTRLQCWTAQVGHNGKVIFCGNYRTVDEAAHAVTAKRLELYTHNDDDRVVRAASA